MAISATATASATLCTAIIQTGTLNGLHFGFVFWDFFSKSMKGRRSKKGAARVGAINTRPP